MEDKYIIIFKQNNSCDYEFITDGGRTTRNLFEAKMYSKISIEEFEVEIANNKNDLSSIQSNKNIIRYAIPVEKIFEILNRPMVIMPKATSQKDDVCRKNMEYIIKKAIISLSKSLGETLVTFSKEEKTETIF